ncbi:MAG TPA: mevalonate kinase [Gammaproteobacteria bacterium]|jgi:mevalonate kinase|nr:mevalonate kinase [Gammaproteobacteria bacterium]
MKVFAPGKLILSGEHAVVHGQPALAMAVNRYAVASVGRGLFPKVSLDLSNLSHSSHLTLQDLLAVKEKVKRKYQRFVRGEYHIRDVLRKPFELVQAALGIVAGSHDITLPDGMRIHVESDIPIGSGMGSSAASILCVMKAASLHLNIPISTDILYQMALEAENLQHGNSSGLDLRVSLHGGCVYVRGAQIDLREIPEITLHLVNTGVPSTSTGECVKMAAPHFASDKLCGEFAAVTEMLDSAIRQNMWSEMQEAVRENHRLLTRIGVVPERVQKFIADAEADGNAAKICGAGSIAGDQGGIVMVMTQDAEKLAALCRQYRYELMTIKGEKRGVHVV